jgi:hypothetical protein
MLSIAKGVESALNRSLFGDSITRRWLGNSLKFRYLGIITNKHVAEELACHCGNVD